MAQILLGKAESSGERFEGGFLLRAPPAPPAAAAAEAEEEEEEEEEEEAGGSVAAVVEVAALVAIEPLALKFASVAPEPFPLVLRQAVQAVQAAR